MTNTKMTSKLLGLKDGKDNRPRTIHETSSLYSTDLGKTFAQSSRQDHVHIAQKHRTLGFLRSLFGGSKFRAVACFLAVLQDPANVGKCLGTLAATVVNHDASGWSGYNGFQKNFRRGEVPDFVNRKGVPVGPAAIKNCL